MIIYKGKKIYGNVICRFQEMKYFDISTSLSY